MSGFFQIVKSNNFGQRRTQETFSAADSLSASKIGLRVEHGGVGRTRPTASASKGGTQSLVDRWVNVDIDLRSEFATQPFSSVVQK